MRLFYTKGTDPAENLALEECLANAPLRDFCPAFLLWQNRPSIIVGRNQVTAVEINADFIREAGIAVVRRMTGGGTVYHDLGNVNFTVILPGRRWGSSLAEEATAPILHALHQLGVPAVAAGRNDLLVDGRKVSGCAQSVLSDRTVFHGTLLFDVDLTVLAKALHPDKEKLRSKGIASVRARVANMRGLLPPERRGMQIGGFLSHLREAITLFYGAERDGFQEAPQVLRERAQLLADKKYRTWEWNYGTAIPCALEKKISFSGGRLRAAWNLQGNLIRDLQLTGDFFGNAPVRELCGALQGLPPKMEDILAALARLPQPLEEYVTGLSPQTLAEMLAVE